MKRIPLLTSTTRILLTTTIILTALGAFGTFYAFAFNCGDTWGSAGPDTFTGDCGPAFSTNTISKTSYWRIFWVDGYERSVGIKDFGQCRQDLVAKTRCFPEFHPPYWRQNSGGYAEWDQITRSAVYNSTSGCVIQNIEHHHFNSHACTTAGGDCNGPLAADPALSLAPGGRELPADRDDDAAPSDDISPLLAQPPGTCSSDYFWDGCQCIQISPIVVDINGNGFNLTGALDGVSFDINGDGVTEHISWTGGATDDAWLTLDRNANGVVDNGQELFGNFTPQPTAPAGEEKNGFLALAVYDRAGNGGNGDGVLDASDTIFSGLRLWQDVNHNGVSEAGELHTLASLDVVRLHLKYKESKRTDAQGNQFRYRAKADDEKGARVNRWAWDVFLVAAP